MFFLRGFIGLLEMLVPVLCLSYGLIAWRASLPQIFAFFGPMLVLSTLLRLRVQRWLVEPRERGIHLAGGLLATATWWVYVIGVICAVFRIKVPYIPTPKEDKPNDAGDIAVPNFIVGGILMVAVAIGVYRDSSPPALLMAALGLANVLALIYVSIVSQQSTMLAVRRRFSDFRLLRHALAKPVIRASKRIYEGVLRQVREGRAIPAAIVLIVGATYLLAMVPHQANTVETPFDVNKDINVGGFYTGFDLGDAPATQRSTRLAALQKGLNFNFRIVALDQRWGDGIEFPLDALKQIRRGGGVPLINWLPMRHATILKSIAAGQFDDYLRQFADRVRSFGEPVLICFAPQADNAQMPWFSAGSNNAGDFVRAWRRIATVFDSRGAANAGWVWNPARAENMDAYFPGEAGEGYVDWIAVSGTRSNAPGDESFADIYRPFRSKAAGWHLPIMIMDLDDAQDSAKQADWLRAALMDISAFCPEVKAVVLGDGSRDRLQKSGWTDDQSTLLSVAADLKFRPFVRGAAEPSPSNQPLWCDLKPVPSISRCVSGAPGHFSLLVDGGPYYIKGVAYNPGHDWRDAGVPLSHRELTDDFSAIRAMGGNTIRRYGKTWSDRNIFNAAQENGLRVLYGFWFFQDVDYLTDTQKEAAYQKQIEQTVLEYRDHPGLLGWCLGNEVWGLLKHEYGQPYLTEVRHAHVQFVERMAELIKQLDPNHPVFSAQESKQIAGAVSDYAKGAPSLDAISINSYYEADISHLDQTVTRIDASRPYLISEFGPDGYWENVNNEYDSGGGLVEQTAVQKAWLYAHRWRQDIQPNAGRNVGGIAYCWRDRYEGTATWFGMTDLDGRFKPAYYALKVAWWNPDPTLNGLFPWGGPKIANVQYPTEPQWPHEPFAVHAQVQIPDGAQPEYQWTVTGPGFAADVGHVVPLNGGVDAMIDLPSQPGSYRVQLKVITSAGLDEANIPIYVSAPHADNTSGQNQGH